MEQYKQQVKRIADYHLKEFLTAGYAAAGCNGPYGDHDTPMRNTAHWCVIYSYLYREYGEKRYLETIQKLAEYLIDEQHYGVSGAAICRTGHNADDTNGVIGQAWVIEGLMAAYQVLLNEEIFDRAVRIFHSQVFRKETGLWKICRSDGKVLDYDYVYNHNLWFAASGCLILENRNLCEIRDKIECFLDKSKYTYTVQPSGRLYHLINHNFSALGKVKFGLKALLTDWNFASFRDMNYLEKGYHLFDLYGFALIKDQFPDHEVFHSRKLKKAVRFGLKSGTIDRLGDRADNWNLYAYPYNSPAFEYPYAALKLGGGYDEAYAVKLLDIQFKEAFDEDRCLFSRNNPDGNTLTARMYEFVRCFNGKEQ